jgi:hypothetical protein
MDDLLKLPARRPAAIDPVGIVRQYVKRDADGERLGPNPWFESIVTWPQDPGYDSHTVIRSYKVEPPKSIAGSPARILVRYDVLGWIVSTGFIPQDKQEAFEFVVVRTDDKGWLIDAPQIDQHILPEVAAAVKFLAPEESARIRELATRVPPED